MNNTPFPSNPLPATTTPPTPSWSQPSMRYFVGRELLHIDLSLHSPAPKRVHTQIHPPPRALSTRAPITLLSGVWWHCIYIYIYYTGYRRGNKPDPECSYTHTSSSQTIFPLLPTSFSFDLFFPPFLFLRTPSPPHSLSFSGNAPRESLC